MNRKYWMRIVRHCGKRPGIRALAAISICASLLSGTSAMARERPLDILFGEADTDHNGLINEAEWHKAMQKRFETLDTNNDSAISKEELEKSRESMRERLRSLRTRSGNSSRE